MEYKTNNSTPSDLGGDYTLIPVPKNKRKHWISVSMVWMGLNICPPTLLLGVWLMRYQSFHDANISLFVGLLIVSVFSISQGIIGTKSGLPTYPISRLSFGDLGGRIFSFIMFLTLIGWFGVMTESMVSTFFTQIFPASGINIPASYEPYFSFLSGMIITLICFFGFTAIEWLNKITIPALLFLTIFALMKILEKPDLIDKVVNWEAPGDSISINTGIKWVVGSLIVAAVTAPDFNRYTKSTKDTILSVTIGNIPVVYFLSIMGMMFAILSGAADSESAMEAADLSSVFASQGWNIGPINGVLLASFILLGAIITTNVVNLYPGAMALVTVIEGSGKYWKYFEDRAVLTVFVGILGSLTASWGILSRFESFLELLTNFSVPLIGIMSTDFFVLNNKNNIKGILNLSAMITWILFSLLSVFDLLIGGSIAAVIYSAITYYSLEKLFGNKLHLKKKKL